MSRPSKLGRDLDLGHPPTTSGTYDIPWRALPSQQGALSTESLAMVPFISSDAEFNITVGHLIPSSYEFTRGTGEIKEYSKENNYWAERLDNCQMIEVHRELELWRLAN